MIRMTKKRPMFLQASVEAMLKTAMQSQLDGVRTGLNLLERALGDINDIKVGRLLSKLVSEHAQ